MCGAGGIHTYFSFLLKMNDMLLRFNLNLSWGCNLVLDFRIPSVHLLVYDWVVLYIQGANLFRNYFSVFKFVIINNFTTNNNG